MRIRIKCACGCGSKFNNSVAPWRYPSYRKLHKYKSGHAPTSGGTGRKVSQYTKDKISKAVRKAMSCPELRRKMGNSMRGRIPWSKGYTKYTHPSLARVSKLLTGRKLSKK